ncbi:MAG: carbohydrate ABC transporter permease [Oscillospiraceae bacterium]|uniref:ABC transporter permease subunit n=2 Tax=Oscillospiraceae TaxID=216572 RepID=A0A859DUW6_9FIRM|nr:carbohydrate ABC transporter permease [Caproicibacterium lactatifermentans]MDD4807702.1 carbohydrate ABC transporter permease [Oscillospiraceae bacterium]QKN24742.1 ABC transporter permease subunit [Caproicibacterium lactatifermentans]QKO31150.1 ABC transporter permease subunit [Caproicibacterium lactatifermentans]
MHRKNKTKKATFVVIGILLGILFLFPIFILMLNSFKNQRGIFMNVLGFPDAKTFTLKNYVQAFQSLDYVTSFMNSLVITVVSTALIMLVSSMAAWVLVRYKTKVSSVIFMLFAAAMLIPFQCVMLPLMSLGSALHMINRVGLVIMYVGFGTSMSIIMFHGFIKNVPEELEEAATIDGCNSIQLFFIIVVPLLKTIMITVAILNVMWIWNDYLLPSLVINKPGWQTLPLKTYLFFGQFSKRWDLASAGLMLCIIPIVIFYLACQKYIVKGVTEGAIK